MNLNQSEKQLAAEAIKIFDNELSSRGCNDLTVKDTEEHRQLFKEFQAWNLKVPIEEVENHPDYSAVADHGYEDSKGKWLILYDSLYSYVLIKGMGLL